jgi:toxin-antitoxin system PIN domain toxin
MIAVDTNILVAFQRLEYPTHARAVEVVTQLAEGRAPWALPAPCLHEFLAVVTHPRIFKTPTPLHHALAAVSALLESPRVRVLSEGSTHWETLSRLLTAGKIAGPAVHDARIAAICLAHGVSELWTADRDFSRFPELTARNPLIG